MFQILAHKPKTFLQLSFNFIHLLLSSIKKKKCGIFRICVRKFQNRNFTINNYWLELKTEPRSHGRDVVCRGVIMGLIFFFALYLCHIGYYLASQRLCLFAIQLYQTQQVVSGSSCIQNFGLYLATTILNIFIQLFPYGSLTNYVYKTRQVDGPKMSSFRQHLYHRKCQRKGIGGQKKPKSCLRSL